MEDHAGDASTARGDGHPQRIAHELGPQVRG